MRNETKIWTCRQAGINEKKLLSRNDTAGFWVLLGKWFTGGVASCEHRGGPSKNFPRRDYIEAGKIHGGIYHGKGGLGTIAACLPVFPWRVRGFNANILLGRHD